MLNPDILAEDQEIEVFHLPSLISTGMWRLDSSRAWPQHRYFWIIRGQGRLWIEGSKRGYAPHSLVFVPSGFVHRITLLQGTLGYAISLPDSLPIAVPSQPCLIRANSVFDQTQITGQFEQMNYEFSHAAPGTEQIMESILTLLGVWIERNQHRNEWQPGDGTRSRKIARKFLRLLERHLSESHDVGYYARELGITPTHLSRICREVLDKPALELIQERLILEARLRLVETDVQVSEISEDLGFASPAYFSRLFSSRAGMSPRTWREKTRAKN